MKMDGTKIVYEVGDWVFGWHTKENDYYAQAWQIESFDREYVCPKCHPDWNTGVHNLRSATQEEIDKATKEEIKPREWWIAVDENTGSIVQLGGVPTKVREVLE